MVQNKHDSRTQHECSQIDVACTKYDVEKDVFTNEKHKNKNQSNKKTAARGRKKHLNTTSIT